MADTIDGLKSRTALADHSSAGDYFALLKPRVMSLVIFTAFAGMVIAPNSLHPVLALVALLCISVGAGAAGAINMWYDRDIDAGMQRTRNRPIPAGRVEPASALIFGIVLAVASVLVMAVAVNLVAAALLASAIGFYIFIYTIWLKRRTPQNIVIGGAAGAFPPMIGWAAMTGEVNLIAVLLFAIIFMWTPPHFWALALYRASDYAKVGVPMLPVVAGARATKLQILLYTLGLIPLTLAPYVIGFSGIFYGLVALLLGAGFMLCAVWVWFDRTDRSARRMFAFSILYLFLLFSVLVADSLMPGAVRIAQAMGN